MANSRTARTLRSELRGDIFTGTSATFSGSSSMTSQEKEWRTRAWSSELESEPLSFRRIAFRTFTDPFKMEREDVRPLAR